MWSLRHMLVPLACLTITGCESTAYYAQAVGGHAGIMIRREPIEQIITDENTPAELRQQLSRVLELRAFAGDRLGLPLEGQYDTYVELDSRYAVWNIFAAPELSLEPRTWCYPVIGCAGYRGYYDRDRALKYADQLRDDGYDVYIGGVAAYSTLGWFSDPILSTFVNLPETELANLLFHELAHQVLFVDGDTMFNESFATAVAREGVRRWFEERGDTGGWHQFEADQEHTKAFLDLVESHRAQLRDVYESTLDEQQKRSQKAAIITELKQSHERLRLSWGGRSRFDGWFAQDINNAQLNAVAAYYEFVPAFEALLRRHQGDLPVFYEEARQLADLDKEARDARLQRLAAQTY